MLYFKRLPTVASALLPLAVTSAIASVITTPAFAETGQLVVTATRMAQTIDQSLVPVSVLTREDIDRSPATSLPELLSQLPGVDFSVSGGQGKDSSLYLRGTNSSHTLVLIDGVRVGSVTLGSTPFQDISLTQIERIEVVRGPRSSLYGSEAIGGVIQIFTKKAQQGVTGSAKVSVGNHNTQALSASVGMGSELGGLALSLSRLKTDGINSQSGYDSDKDGYENSSASINLNLNISDKTQAKITALHTDANNQFDRSPAPFNDYAENMQQTLGVRVSSELSDSWSLSGGVSQHRDESETHFLEFDLGTFTYIPAQSQINTKRYGVDLKTDHYLSENQTLTLGIDYQKDQISSSQAYLGDERDNTAVFAQWQMEYGKLGVLTGLRHDDNEHFGSKNTGNINLGYQLDHKRRVLASYGTAFKAPTFNDLYWPADPYGAGNPSLIPETSESVELGYEVNNGSVDYAARLFMTDIDNLIEWACTADCDADYLALPYPFWQPSNVSRARIKGLELESSVEIEQWRGRATLSFLDPRNRDSDNYLAKRARRTLQLDLTRSFNAMSLSASLLAQGERFKDAANTAKLPGYAVVNLKAQYDLDKSWTVEAKVNNLLDKEYSTNSDYNSLDRTYLLSLAYNH